MSREFLQFCQSHGLIGAGAITAPGLTKRCTTTCNTSRENGWWRYDGRNGVCGIWGSLTAQQYRPGADAKPLSKADFAAIAARARQAAELERIKHASAATKAAAMLAASDMRSHAYIARKGFPELLTPTLDDGATLLVTMWKGKRLVNLHRINEAGENTPQHQAIYELLQSLDQQARDSANQIVDDLHDSGINARSAAGHKGDFIIELITPASPHVIAGCQL